MSHLIPLSPLRLPARKPPRPRVSASPRLSSLLSPLSSLLPLLLACPLLAPAQPNPGFDISALDKSVNACEDFYQFACGGWRKANPIPPDQPTWGRFNELQERNRDVLHDILEKVAAPNPGRASYQQKIGDYYASCMDEQTINQKALAPLQPELDRIGSLQSKSDLTAHVAHLHNLGVRALFRFDSGQDFKDSTQVIAEADQGGLGLPDRDYYFKEDPKSVETRKLYLAHVGKMFELLGSTPERAAAQARVVMTVETALAKGSLDRVSRRDPSKLYHRLSFKELTALAPSFPWSQYFKAVGTPPVSSLNVVVPDFFKQMEATLASTSLDDAKTYLTWQLVHTAAVLLPTPFVNENFAFYGKTLTGARELRPRWKRCTEYTDHDLGEALGRQFVERTFGAEGKARTLKMVEALERALARDLEQLPWMTPATKKQAFAKLHAVTNKIGYSDKWRDYDALHIVRGDALGNSLRANTFEFHRQLAKIDKPLDRTEWYMSPPTVNAYYDPQMNNINFPAGILQPPFFDNKMDDAVNFGGIGAVIGHELTHGFDDMGRQFDPQGNLRDWWTAEDAKEFEKRASCIAGQYSSFVAVDDVKLNGRLTLGENTADNGGLRIAYMALLDALSGKPAPPIDGFTPQQRLFLNWSQVWCTNETDAYLRLQAAINPHSPARHRVNGVVSNMPEFQQAFQCKPGQPMVRKDPCRVW